MVRKKEPATLAGVERVLREYRRLWRERYGVVSCHDASGWQLVRCESLVGAIGVGELKRRLAVYMNRDDRWLEERGHPLGVFLSQVDEYVGGNHGKKDGVARREGFDAREINRRERGRRKKG